jgi:hypothetical protein
MQCGNRICKRVFRFGFHYCYVMPYIRVVYNQRTQYKLNVFNTELNLRYLRWSTKQNICFHRHLWIRNVKKIIHTVKKIYLTKKCQIICTSTDVDMNVCLAQYQKGKNDFYSQTIFWSKPFLSGIITFTTLNRSIS